MNTTLLKLAIITIALILVNLNALYSQELIESPKGNKGDFYVYYGWNASAYSNSDISFSGDGYDFTLFDVEALDRPSKFRVDLYLNPKTFTIPQYNFRVGYFITDHISVSIGVDHMKYVVTNGQSVNITGSTKALNSTETFIYGNEPIVISKDFLQFEHTDGLNYINADTRLTYDLFAIGNLSFVGDLGGGLGFLLPRTNTQILGRERHDAFHLSGFGLNGLAALDVRFYDNYFIKTEIKGGYINMPDIRTTDDSTDSASQSFWFSQLALVFGVQF